MGQISYCQAKFRPHGLQPMNPLAVEFVRYTLRHNPGAHDFATIYDAMTRVACARSFHNLSREELALIGISFSLLAIDKLEYLVAEAQKSFLSEESIGLQNNWIDGVEK
jgi:hypothetical protein